MLCCSCSPLECCESCVKATTQVLNAVCGHTKCSLIAAALEICFTFRNQACLAPQQPPAGSTPGKRRLTPTLTTPHAWLLCAPSSLLSLLPGSSDESHERLGRGLSKGRLSVCRCGWEYTGESRAWLQHALASGLTSSTNRTWHWHCSIEDWGVVK